MGRVRGKLLFHLLALALDQVTLTLQTLQLGRLLLQLSGFLQLLIFVSFELLFLGDKLLFELCNSLEVAAALLTVEEGLSTDSTDGRLDSRLLIL